MSDFWKSFGANALSGAASGITGSLLGLGNTAFAMRKGFNYAKKMFNLENQRQDYLLNNADLIRKHSLEKAGYSTADPAGTGTTAATPVAMPSAPSGNLSMPSINSGSIRDLSSLHLQEAQADYYDVLARKEGTANELLKLDLQKYKETYETQVNTIMSEYYNLTKQNRKLDTEIDYTSGLTQKTEDERKLIQKQTEEVKSRINKFAAETANITIDTKFKEATFNDRVSTITTQLQKLEHERDIAESEKIIKGVESQLSQLGIITGQGWIQSIFSMAALGRGDIAIKGMSDFLTSAMNQLTKSLPSVLGTFVNTIFDIAVKVVKSGAQVPAF